MARAEYSERHYELAVNVELVRNVNEYFVPSQNEEAELGYDIALVPALPRVWSSLVRGLEGIGDQSSPRIPKATSLFLQFKRPDHISNRRGKQARTREAFFHEFEPYYRFDLPKAQLAVLLDLEANSQGKAEVCYTAGRFYRQVDFASLKLQSEVAANSIFLRLGDVRSQLLAGGHDPAALTRDHIWTYDEMGGTGLLCSDPRPVMGLDLGRLKASIRDRVASAEPLNAHLDRVAADLSTWRLETVEPMRTELRDELDYGGPTEEVFLPPAEDVDPAVATQQALDALGLGWFLAMAVRARSKPGSG